MALEDMKKDELVKHARSLEQQIKLMELEKAELEQKLEEFTKDEDKPSDQVELPYKAFSMVKNSNIQARIIPITFDLEGNAKAHVDNAKVFNAPYKAAHKLNEYNVREVEHQKVKKED